MAIPEPLPFVLVAARLAGLVASSPLFAHGLVPLRVRAGVTGVLALTLAPAVSTAAAAAPSSGLALAAMVALEAAIGVCLGLVAQLLFAGVELGGQVAGLQLGFGIGGTIDPTSPAGATVLAQWQQLTALLVFVVLDVHHMLLRAVLESFRVAPIGGAGLSTGLLDAVVARGASLFAVGVRIAAPVLVVLLLVNGGLAALARTIPQLNAFAVGLPVQVGVGLVVAGASIPFTAHFLVGQLVDLGGVLHGLVTELAHG